MLISIKYFRVKKNEKLLFIFDNRNYDFNGCKSKSNVAGGDIKNNANSRFVGQNNIEITLFQDCVGKTLETVSVSDAFNFCNCMTEKVEAKYPDETTVDEKLSDKEIQTMKVECLSLKDYCDCMLKKLIQAYPDSKDVYKATHLNALC